MEYEEALEYLFTQLPMYQRLGAAAYKKDLSNTIRILDYLGNPQNGFKSIHIAGTNGKGSTAHMMASVLQEAGFKVGLSTSPHLKDYRERIRINGKVISALDVLDFVSEHKDNLKNIDASFFEITVGMAFWYFEKEKVDIAIIETGLGGRLDSTNVINPEVSVITNIGMDHMQFLGDTIEKIAKEKGGIIKKNIPIVLGEMKAEAKAVLKNIATGIDAPIYDASNLEGKLPVSDLLGAYQKSNAKTAILALKVLKNSGWEINSEHIVQGFSNIQKNTGLKGRWQILGTEPMVVIDGAHNEDGIKAVIKNALEICQGELHIALAVVSDKEIDKILELFPKSANYYFASAKIQRALPVENLIEKANQFGLKGESYSSIGKALEAARIYAITEDFILVTGSMFTIAEVV